jgi:nucleoside diphosphate kinase
MQTAVVEIVNTLEGRELQLEAARVIASHKSTSKFIKQFRADNDSRQFYRNAVVWYISQYGGFPSEIGPGVDVKLIHEDLE